MLFQLSYGDRCKTLHDAVSAVLAVSECSKRDSCKIYERAGQN